MFSSQHQADDLERLVNLFRLIVTKDPSALNAVSETLQTKPSLLTRELTFNCEWSGRCECVLDHEYFRYISGNKIEEVALDKILKNIANGQCTHLDSLLWQNWLRNCRPSVTLAHAAAVVGNAPVLEIVLQLPGKQSQVTSHLKLSPLYLAILHNKQHCVRTIIELRQGIDLELYCKSIKTINWMHQYRQRSIVELCMVMKNFEALKQILDCTPLQSDWIKDALKSESNESYEIVYQYVNSTTLSKFDKYTKYDILQQGIRNGNHKLVEMLIKVVDKREFRLSPNLLAVIYNQPKILEYFITSIFWDKDDNFEGFTLLDISDSLNHVECSAILKTKGLDAMKKRSKNPLRVILEIGKRLTHERHTCTNILIKKIGDNGEFEDTDLQMWSEEVFHRSLGIGLGVRELLSLCHNIDFKLACGLSPLTRVMFLGDPPTLILDVLYNNPSLNQIEQVDLIPRVVFWLGFRFIKSKTASMLCLAIERDEDNSAYHENERTGSLPEYEGSMAVLLLDCGYDIRADDLIHTSYSTILEECKGSASEDEIRSRIKDRIDRELYFPKPLKERCRDVLRRHFIGPSLHRYVASVGAPLSVREFVLMESRFKQRHDYPFSWIE